jgi:hypothetical protein
MAMPSFLLRLLFPKTSQIEDYAKAIAAKDSMIQSLVDAVVKGRGEVAVFGKGEGLGGGKAVRTSNPYTADQKAWLQNEKLKEDELIVAEAVEDEEAYAELYQWVQEGREGAEELMVEVERRLQLIVMAEERADEEVRVQ